MLSLRFEPYAGPYAARERKTPLTVSLAEAARLAGLASEAEFRQAAYEVQSQARIDEFSILCFADGSHRAPIALAEAVRNRRRSAAIPAISPSPSRLTSSPPPAASSPTEPGKEVQAMQVMTVDDFVKANPRDAGFAGALALCAAMDAQATGQADKIYDLTRQRPPTRGMDTVRRDAAAEFDAKLREKVVRRAEQRRALGRSSSITAMEMVKLREQVFAENKDLRERMLAEANAGRGKWGLRPQGR